MNAALTMFLILCFLMCYRRLMQFPFIQRYLHNEFPVSNVVFQYYTLVLATMLVLILESGFHLVSDMMPLLGHARDVERTLNTTLNSVPGMAPEQVEYWRTELHIDKSLQKLSVHAPVATVATVAIVAVHVLHLVGDHDVNGLPWFPSRRQDWILQVILLPAVYAAVALRCVIRSWMVMLGSSYAEFTSKTGDASFAAYVDQEMTLYDANFAVANFAEMYTLWCFSILCLDLLREDFDRKENYFVFSRVTLQGVNTFVLIGIAQVLCQLILTSTDLVELAESGPVVSYLVHRSGLRLEHIQEVHGYLKVLLVIASIQCLYNGTLLCFLSHLREINASLKFTGVRILIMFAQWQGFGLDLAVAHKLIPYTSHQVKLLHASLMCYECLAVAMLHVISWPAGDYVTGYIPLEDDTGGGWRKDRTTDRGRGRPSRFRWLSSTRRSMW